MLTSKDIAEYFVAQTDEDSGDALSNMKAQKLVYYAQGFHLAIHSEPLFEEDIEAWMHGPVVPTLYQEYKKFGNSPLPLPNGLDFEKFSPEVKELLDDVYNVYGQYSAWKLRQMTHNESPWKDSYDGGKGRVIPKAAMTEFFKSRLVE